MHQLIQFTEPFLMIHPLVQLSFSVKRVATANWKIFTEIMT